MILQIEKARFQNLLHAYNEEYGFRPELIINRQKNIRDFYSNYLFLYIIKNTLLFVFPRIMQRLS